MIGVIWWSATGNTEDMANTVASAIEATGKQALNKNVADISVEQALTCEAIAFGCPAMGDEVLEEMEFEPFFTDIESLLAGKKIALFGSYGWGTGAWMEEWAERARNAGAEVVGTVITCGSVDDDVNAELESIAEALAE